MQTELEARAPPFSPHVHANATVDTALFRMPCPPCLNSKHPTWDVVLRVGAMTNHVYVCRSLHICMPLLAAVAL